MRLSTPEDSDRADAERGENVRDQGLEAGHRPAGPWRRIHRASIVVRATLIFMGVVLWLVLLLLAGTVVSSEIAEYTTAAPLLAAGHLMSGLLFRASRWQGASTNAHGDLLLTSPFGARAVRREDIEKLQIDTFAASLYVWTGGTVLWLEVGSPVRVGRAGLATLERTAQRLRDAVGVDVVLGPSTFVYGDKLTSLEFSFKGFPKIMRSSAVWSTVLVGQVLLLTALP